MWGSNSRPSRYIWLRDLRAACCANEALAKWVYIYIYIYIYIFKHFSTFFPPRVRQTQKLYQFINPGSSLLLPKRKYETKSATYISAYNICIYVRKSGILVAEVTLSQGLSLTLGDHSAWSSFKIYEDTRKLVDGIFTFNFSYHFCIWTTTFLWFSRPVLLVDQSTDNLIQLILNNPAATELISSIKGDFPVIRYCLRYWTPGWFNY